MDRLLLVLMVIGGVALNALSSILSAAHSSDFAPENITVAASASERTEKQQSSRKVAGPAWCEPWTLRGKLFKGKHQHPNGSWFTIFALTLEKPFSLPESTCDGGSPSAEGVKEVQIKADEAILEGMLGKTIEVSGEIHPPEAAYDVRPAIMIHPRITEITNSSTKIVTAAQVNGTWDSGPGTFKVFALGNQRLKVEFSGLYEHQTPIGLMANTGEGSGIAFIQGATAIFKPDGADDDCRITMTFADAELIVEQEGTCGFGMNVTATGRYKKVSSKKPHFSEY